MREDTIQETKTISTAELNKIRQKKRILSLLHVNGHSSAIELAKWLKISLPTCIVFCTKL